MIKRINCKVIDPSVAEEMRNRCFQAENDDLTRKTTFLRYNKLHDTFGENDRDVSDSIDFFA